MKQKYRGRIQFFCDEDEFLKNEVKEKWENFDAEKSEWSVDCKYYTGVFQVTFVVARNGFVAGEVKGEDGEASYDAVVVCSSVESAPRFRETVERAREESRIFWARDDDGSREEGPPEWALSAAFEWVPAEEGLPRVVESLLATRWSARADETLELRLTDAGHAAAVSESEALVAALTRALENDDGDEAGDMFRALRELALRNAREGDEAKRRETAAAVALSLEKIFDH